MSVTDDFGNVVAVADAADEWYPLRIAGSLDCGTVDTEFTLPPYICAADDRHAELADAFTEFLYARKLDGDAADQRHADHERRIAGLEDDSKVVWSILNPHDARLDELEQWCKAQEADNERTFEFNDRQHNFNSERIAGLETQVHRLLNAEKTPTLEITHYPTMYIDAQGNCITSESGYAHIPLPEWEALTAELESLRAFKAAAPDTEAVMRINVALHKSAGESIEEIVRLSSELSELRAFKAAHA